MKKILFVLGTRPEVIKCAPVIKVLKKNNSVQVLVCVTSQQRQMQDQMLKVFNLDVDYDLDLMKPNQSLNYILSATLEKLDEILIKEKPSMVLVQGDTTTAMAAAMAAANQQIAIGHIEAGLRTNNKAQPFPEEINRQVIGRLATLHFAPTQQTKENLLAEGIAEESIIVTGNTVIDALLWKKSNISIKRIEKELPAKVTQLVREKQPFVLITGHRRENFGEGFQSICDAVALLASRYPLWHFVYPVHLNPNIRAFVYLKLGSFPNIMLIDPAEYESFIYLLSHCRIVLTDSGGIQEEAPSLGKPVLVMRDITERSEGISAGVAKLVGAKRDSIVKNVALLIEDKQQYRCMANAVNPYGDGKAAIRIVDSVINWLYENA